jgi:hypothetical protein
MTPCIGEDSQRNLSPLALGMLQPLLEQEGVRPIFGQALWHPHLVEILVLLLLRMVVLTIHESLPARRI